jgi:PIN domain nuclease of toxin-antitoxin system
LSVLIDTRVFLWFQTRSPRLSKRVRALIEDPNQIVHLSAASFWEIAIKRRAGKLTFDGPLRAAAADSGLLELAIDAMDGETAGALDWNHRDPFDRMLVAQCLNRSFTLATADTVMRKRDNIAILWAA